MALSTVASKWLKTQVLLKHPQIAQHIPHTMLFSARNLRSMLARHGMVVLKPVRGGGGHGVIKVTRASGRYVLAYRASAKVYSSFGAMLGAVNRIRRGRFYLIQKGIHLAQVGGRPIDYRVKYVKIGDQWRFRAILGRIARPGLFVTNICQGGRLVPAAEGLRRSLNPQSVVSKKNEMRHLTKISTSLLQQRFPGLSQLGYDYGIDQRGHIWILEVNTRPQ
jgi:glutathione synthase/RimK-type ligase-like ATP-grasp enzyme